MTSSSPGSISGSAYHRDIAFPHVRATPPMGSVAALECMMPSRGARPAL